MQFGSLVIEEMLSQDGMSSASTLSISLSSCGHTLGKSIREGEQSIIL